jgi:hypothetical protein
MTWEKAAGIVRALVLFAAGAGAMTCFLHLTLVPKVAEVEWIYGQLSGWWFVLISIDCYCQSKREPASVSPDTGPDYSGAGVVLLTGFVAAGSLARDYHRPGDLIVPVAVALASLAVAVVMARFARRHEGDIGEARFDTRNRDVR